MIPKLVCSSCGHELSPQDKFCSNCGASVAIDESSEESRASTTVHCRLCGSENPAGSRHCSACGAVLKSEVGEPRPEEATRAARKSDEPKHRARPERKSQEHKRQAGKGLAQGKIIAVFGGLLIVGVIVIGITRNQTKTVPSGSGAQSTVSPTLVQDIEQLRKRVEADSTDSGAMLRLANLLHDGKFMDQAIVYYKKYLVLNEKDPDARVDLGICYFERGDKDRAIAEMRKALTYAPTHQLAHFNLGIVNLGSGNIDVAIEWFKKCIAIAPQTETARRAEELIKQHTGSSTLKLN